MKKISKSILLLTSVILLSGCLPFQSSKYPAWTTKGILESYTLSDGTSIDGWMGVNIGDKISIKGYDFTINTAEEVDSYQDYKPNENKKIIHVSVTISNTSDKNVEITDEEFALVWNLEKEDRSYVYPIKEKTEKEMLIKIKETKTIDLLFEVDKNSEKPMAIYYYEQYSDGQKGNKYYIYYR